MKDYLKFYINGQWVDPATPKTLEVINPANEEPFARISMGSAKDVDKAVAAAKAAFPKFSTTTKQERIELLQSIMAVYQKRYAEIAADMAFAMVGPSALERVFFPLGRQRTVIRDEQPHNLFQAAHVVAAGAGEADPVFFERPGVVRRARPRRPFAASGLFRGHPDARRRWRTGPVAP